jgi:hypothetical protein
MGFGEEVVDGGMQEEVNQGTEIAEGGHAAEEPSVEASSGEEAGEGAEEGAAAAAQAQEQYTPNFKFRVRGLDEEEDDDGDELEFDEFLRGVVTNKETEEKLRDLYTRAYGLDAIKPRHQKLQERYQAVTKDYGKLDGTIRDILRLRDEGDYGAFLQKVGIPTTKLAEWLVSEIQAQQLPPEERRIHEERARLARENRELRSGREQASEHDLSLASQIYHEELQEEMREEDVRPLIRAYDKRMGERGAFEEFVLDYGSRYYQRHGKNIRPAKAVRECLRILGLDTQAPSQGAQPSGSAQPKPVVTAPKVAVIPNTGPSASGTPVKKPKSIADLKKLANGQSL